ncbi:MULTISPECIES: DUF1236 domain-containing protein [Rhizobium/Agrobacterium group]|jgi:hypothetical protein|uniref:Outer membrane lipoprotein SlyB n=1 Tax=Rhizobium soli TaxID=424798 RepID=A0A7X0JG83_9HYPH|nr:MULTISPECIES: DUF1236 domain-containing protein [Rhizobium/Agrobacterium group]RYE69558.1 MAG: DUF1236 domain-containing protein [Rhizobiaceae bacterium]KQQ36740.1 hypothetical protein ASG19_10115 [Rhizobium sp. Leaf306]KQQ72886.1 hypothetical protein ASF70_15530 [Rhizobium sp. Leaf321]MBB6507021.1 outer membrane lipoprotein SlyB [Rhizobium soli]MBD8650794.1 DUF1236 domain-containing protein [Rhizobium sp. CFBP 13726]
MKTKILVLSTLLSIGIAPVAMAQQGTVNGAAGGAVTGAIVGGPVGAAVGGVAGAIVGSAIDPPPQRVVTYVEQQPMPTERVVVKERIVVGQAVPETVVLSQIPEAPEYSYTVVNEERVIVDPQTRKVVQIIR